MALMKLFLLLGGGVLNLLLLGTLSSPAPDTPAPSRGKLVHMVSFKFKEDASKDGIRKVEEAFAALPSKIPQIVSYEWGTNVSPEGLNKGFTHGFLLTFNTAKDRDDYLVHKDHKAFAQIIGPYIADVFVIDFWAETTASKPTPAK
jgi:hypothetical protein